MYPWRLQSLACLYEWHSPWGCACPCLYAHVFLYTFLHMCFCMYACVLKISIHRNSSLLDLSVLLVSLKATGWRWETERHVAGHHTYTVTCLSPVVGIQAIMMSSRWTHLSVSPGTNLLKAEGETYTCHLFYFVAATAVCLDVMIQWCDKETPLEIPHLTLRCQYLNSASIY